MSAGVAPLVPSEARPHALPKFAVVESERVTYPADPVAPSQHELFHG